MKIAIVSVAPPYRGGISLHSAILYQHLSVNHKVNCYNFSRQYPNFLFPGKTQLEKGKPAVCIPSDRCIDSINPLTWLATANKIIRSNPDVVIFRYWNPYFAILMGMIARKIRRKIKNVQCIALCDNIIPHEKHLVDNILTKFFIKSMESYIVMSNEVESDLKKFVENPKYAKLYHPVYNVFGDQIKRDEAKYLLGVEKKYIILYFGYVREYKGMDILIKATKILKEKLDNFQIVAVGESYEGEEKYRKLISENGVEDEFTWISEYIPDNEVAKFFSASDVVALPYRSATQSGIVQIAYHFNKPVVVTNVGGLPEMVSEGKSGFLITPDNPNELANYLFENLKSDKFSEMEKEVSEYKKRFSWENFVQGFESLVTE
ncbi:MAG: glycosyltransferase [Candidatus Marinimicrobia bacterium]|nr:glycosyltransferase [Candidatus Neomarinimicrobiota bacterium]MBL7023460.1 glycosyltransferase [Candidatus Neomarinimicrobiota bacterium]MBL7109285.1 glycosyltransferase [Candidatus Neomarinimicrobiota bacterium]